MPEFPCISYKASQSVAVTFLVNSIVYLVPVRDVCCVVAINTILDGLEYCLVLTIDHL